MLSTSREKTSSRDRQFAGERRRTERTIPTIQALPVGEESRQQVVETEFRARAILDEQRCAFCRSGELRVQSARGERKEFRSTFDKTISSRCRTLRKKTRLCREQFQLAELRELLLI